MDRRLFTSTARDELLRLVDLDPAETVQSFDEVSDSTLSSVELLVTGWGSPRVDAEALERMPSLRAVVHGAGTVKHLIGPEAWARGITVSSAAAANAYPVAEYTLAAILFAGKNVFWISRRYAEGPDPFEIEMPNGEHGNFGRTIGLVGASQVGRRVIELLAPFDVDVLVYDPYLDAAEADRLGVRSCGLHELMASSSIVSLHAPAVASTEKMIGAAELAAMPDGATLVNTARAQLVDQDALVRELEAGRLRAVIDVTAPEVLPMDHPLRLLPNVYLTPHVAGAQGREISRLGDSVVGEVARFVAGEAFAHEVRADRLATMA